MQHTGAVGRCAMKRILLRFFGVGLLLAAEPILAHHGFTGAFDLKTPTTFEVTISNVEWENPHISFSVDVKDKTGKVTSWRFEGASLSALRSRGWARTDLKFGEKVIVKGYRAKNGAAVAAAGAVTLPSGRTLDASSDGVVPTKK